MEKFIMKKENLNLKRNSNGVSGFNHFIGGFFIVDKGSNIPDTDYVEIHTVREIQDKRGKKVKIVRLKNHKHSLQTPTDRFYKSRYCSMCSESECTYRKEHEFTYVYETKNEFKHVMKKKCVYCGYEEEVEEHHDDFEITIEDDKKIRKKIRRCKCGYEEVEVIRRLDENEIENFKRVIVELKEKKNLLKADIQELENQEKKMKEDVEKLKLQLRINLPNEKRFQVKRNSSSVLINEVILDSSDSEKIRGVYYRRNSSFLWKGEVEINSSYSAEEITVLDKDEIPENVRDYLKEKIREREEIIQLIRSKMNQIEEMKLKLRELYNESGKLYDKIREIEKLLEQQR